MKKILSGKYYSAFSRTKKCSDRSQLIIIRRDTHELELAITISTKNLQIKAKTLIESLPDPTDWLAPSRACLFYFLKIKRKKEAFAQKLLSDTVSKRQIFLEIKKFEAYRYHLLKKLHKLSPTDKSLLLTPSKRECAAQSTEDIDLLQARDEIFGLFFAKTKSMSQAHEKVVSIIRKIKSSQLPN